MKKSLSTGNLFVVGVMLFGMFFGAGNLIYPIMVGQTSGSNMILGAVGFLISAVGIPIASVAALGMSRSEGLFDLSGKVGRGYAYFFTCTTYLTIGPLFAIPRCATVPFEVGVAPLIGDNAAALIIAQAVYSVIFFAVVLALSLRPGNILTSIGKILTPAFLVSFAILVVAVLVKPMGSIGAVTPVAEYTGVRALLSGFFKGYDTLDGVAGLVLGIVVINVIRDKGVTEPGAIASNTMRSGAFSGLMMAFIYVLIVIIGAQSRAVTEICTNGGQAFAVVAKHYFGTPGMIILAVIFAFACLKTAVGLVTSCSEGFCAMFPKGPSYKAWAIIFSVVALLIANLGLNAITSYSAPLLYFLYPLSITLIIMALCSKWIGTHREIYVCVTAFTLIAALFDFVKFLPEQVAAPLHLPVLVDFAQKYLPLYDYGLGWICFAAVGLVIGLAIALFKPKKKSS